jgi:sterol desaturase/sphingolipid hydroxylase (fatty acid hydroxylase superfamily)
MGIPIYSYIPILSRNYHPMLLLSTFIGVVCWTLTEYLLHRFLGHVHKGRNFFKEEHVRHHSTPNYFAPAYKKGMIALIVSFVLFVSLSYVIGIEPAFFFTVGYTGMYLIYELTHYRYHASEPVPFFINFRKHHFYHHYHNPMANHGVTSRFWDRVFGTYVRIEDPVKVPKKMAPDWLTESESQELRSKYLLHFRLVGR